MTKQAAVLERAEAGGVVRGRADAGVVASSPRPVTAMVPAGRGVLFRLVTWWVARVSTLRAPVEVR